MKAGEQRIAVVRGALDDERGERILTFWAQHSSLPADMARDRLAEVVCVVLDAAGDVVGVNSAHAADVPVLSERRFWVYRSLLAPAAEDGAWDELLETCVATLAAEFEADPDGWGLPHPPPERQQIP